jgi:hypothetical protein
MVRSGALKEDRRKDEITVIHNTDVHGPITVHKLMNVYYMMTGEELELKYISCNTCTNYYNPKTISKCPVCNPLIVKNDSEQPMMGMSY